MKRYCILAIAAASLTNFATAQDMEEKPWAMAIELGATSTSGNTESLSVQSKADIRHDMQDWRNQYIASILFKEDEVVQEDGTEATEKTAEKYFLSAKSAYKLDTEDTSVFVYGSYTEDEFGAFQKYMTASLGYGSRILDRPDMYLDTEIGPGYFRGERVTETDTIEVEQGAMLRGAFEFRWQLTEYATFDQTVSVESGSDNTRTISDTSLATRVSDRLQMKVGYSVFHNTDVAPDKEELDTTTFINLVYNL